jgi:hypothetical protein
MKRCRGSGDVSPPIPELGSSRRLEVRVTPGSQGASSIEYLLILKGFKARTVHTMAHTFAGHIFLTIQNRLLCSHGRSESLNTDDVRVAHLRLDNAIKTEISLVL